MVLVLVLVATTSLSDPCRWSYFTVDIVVATLLPLQTPCRWHITSIPDLPCRWHTAFLADYLPMSLARYLPLLVVGTLLPSQTPCHFACRPTASLVRPEVKNLKQNEAQSARAETTHKGVN